VEGRKARNREEDKEKGKKGGGWEGVEGRKSGGREEWKVKGGTEGEGKRTKEPNKEGRKSR
jgi:hypothetical protein